ncbi:MAG: serine/threonine-protein kinase [Chloroherpetonaceae bacterium]|nr:serine/threonine protein kinase [Chthonomonadaceae bacterium]MDW8206668.1 serine/threonine-protein kinase [Chloroherpetonaceae bacterium]
MALGTLGKYERLEVLGHGVSGIVYLARDTLLRRLVALKEIDAHAGEVDRFLEEARVLVRLDHPNIVKVYGAEQIDDRIVIVMEYVRGQNLQSLLRVGGAMPLEQALDIAAQALAGLDYAHRLQIVHRDIKPANILIGRDGVVKLADFGLAEILATNAYAGGAGTYAYMAPEDFAEEDRSDHRSDLWAMGVTLFEMLTLHRPFQVSRVKDPFAWKRAVENELPAPLSAYLDTVDAALQAVLDRALARRKSDRYPTAEAFRADLMRLLAGEQVAEPTLQCGEETARQRRAAPVEDRVQGAGGAQTLHAERASSGPGVVVAEVVPSVSAPDLAVVRSESPPEARPLEGGLRRFFARRQEPVQIQVRPERVDFGAVRKGELRSMRVQVQVQGVEGPVHGRVQHAHPGWLTVYPTSFHRPRQKLTLTAHTARAWETGEFRDTIRIETKAGVIEIPVRLIVLKPRPAFRQIAWWYLPLLAMSLLPTGTVALGAGHSVATAATLLPVSTIASALLGVMLWLICAAIDSGLIEKVACGTLVVVMSFLLGGALSQHGGDAHLPHTFVTGVLIGGFLLLQVLLLRWWKLWAVLLVGLSLLISGVLWLILLA